MRLATELYATQEKRWPEARKLLDGLLRSDDKDVVASAASGIGEAYQGEGENLAAAEYFMTAAYVAPDSQAGRSGLLGAGACFVALKQNDAAEIVYRVVDTRTSLQNCGACGRACGAAQTCAGGTCVCLIGTLCSGRCVDVLSDPLNCGGRAEWGRGQKRGRPGSTPGRSRNSPPTPNAPTQS